MALLSGFRQALRELTDGLDVRDTPGSFRRDTIKAYGVLGRDHLVRPEPAGFAGRWWFRIRVLFLGLSSKLSPPRRLLFLACIALALWGLVDLPGDGVGPLAGRTPLVLAVAGLVLLLALELADRVLVRDELEVARQLQRELLPAHAPEVEGYSFAFSYRTANTIGGDYYDFLPAGDGRLGLIVGDASGHGIAAGLVMAIAHAALRAAIDLDPSPRAVMDLVNRALYRSGGPRAFMTLFYGLLDPGSGRLDYACAGHPYPLLRRADGEVVELGAGSLPLGLRAVVAPAQGSEWFHAGDLLVMYTDGVPETFDGAGNAFGFDALRGEAAAGGAASAVHQRITSALERFAGGAPLVDDRSLLIISRRREREA
jgi:sigma-B regulation protein RsbU (phosphoserine phosphatase)